MSSQVEDNLNTYFPQEEEIDKKKKEQSVKGSFRKKSSLTYEAVVYRYKSFGMLALMTLSACMGSAYFGFNQTMFGTLLDPYLSVVFRIEEGSKENIFVSSIFNGFHCLGTMSGSFLSGQILTALGRRQSFITVDCIAIVAQLLYQVPVVEIAFFARFLCGFFVGFNSCSVIIYLNEMIPIERAGLFVGMNPFMINFSILIAYTFGFGEVNTMGNYWRWVVAFPVLLCLFRLYCLLFIFKHETPNYTYLVLGDREKAREAVASIYKEEYVEMRMMELDEEKALMGKANTLWDLLKRPANRKRILYGSILMYFQQLIGVNSVFFYASEVFESASTNSQGVVNHTLDSIYSIMLAIINAVAAMFVGGLIDRLGRRRPLMFGLCINIISLVLIGVAFKVELYKLVPWFFYIYILGFNFGMGAVAWVALCEIVPNQGAHIAVLANWTGDLTITATFKYLVLIFSEAGTFFLFAFNAVLSLIFVYFCIIETIGKSEVQIAIEYGEDPKVAEEAAKYAVKAKAGH